MLDDMHPFTLGIKQNDQPPQPVDCNDRIMPIGKGPKPPPGTISVRQQECLPVGMLVDVPQTVTRQGDTAAKD